jgi:simple sugar transport system permease protein
METAKKYLDLIGIPRLIITSFFLLLLFVAFLQNIDVGAIMGDTLVRYGMNGVMVLAMVPSIQCGIGPNFGLPLGIVAGLLGILISIEMRFSGMSSFIVACLISIPLSMLIGWLYALMLNRIKGSEMLVSTYTGFSIVSLFSIVWIVAPFTHPQMRWPIGMGLRTTIALDPADIGMAQILDDIGKIAIGTMNVPTGMLIFFFVSCFLMFLFTKSKTGVALRAVGDNPNFARASGIDVDRSRIIGTVLSTILGGIGIVVFSQSFGFVQLYQAPLNMAFPAVAGILIGGASAKKATITHVIIGTFLFQGLLTVAMPVANNLVPEGNLSEVMRMIVQNGIILYALTKVGGEK